jgi:hypothetical protein
VRYRAYFPPGYPYEERARAALEANAHLAAGRDNMVGFRTGAMVGSGYVVENLRALSTECPVCSCEWQVWVPWRNSHSTWQAVPGPVDPGKCPACSPVAAELDSKERARLLAEIATANTVDLTCMLALYPEAIPTLVVACDAAQSSRAVAEYRSPCDIARIEELENALASVGLLV